ncbi:ATP-binding cassette domain-containing protein, partial [Sulfuricurvum sp.]|uniref:ATP-binding cassette domain-containing protein n=1 Tax=Sulfuricurvum sp. TaxID=2025608 RepID=UPI00261640DE
MNTVASLKEITHRYGDTVAVDNASVNIPAGCMVGFIGPDGVGKSTLLALISGVRIIQQGSIEVFGGNIAE